MRPLLAHRDGRLYLAGQSLSLVGDSALWLAMGIWVKLLTGSNSAAGMIALVSGTLLAPLTGLPAVLAGMLGLGIVWVNVGWITLVQRWTPAALLGRVDAALTVAITVPQVMSIALGAVLIAVVSYRVLLAVVVAAGGGHLAVGRDEQAVRRDEPAAVPKRAAAGGPGPGPAGQAAS